MELFGAEVRLRQMARLRNFVRKNGPRGFRAVLFRMVPKLATKYEYTKTPPSSSLGGVMYVGHRFVMS